MKPTDVRAIITLAGRGSGMNNVNKQHNKPTAIVLLRCICGYSRPTEEKVSIQGKVVGKDMEFPESMGLLLEVPGFLPSFTAKENLQMLMDIRHRRLPEKNELICDALKLVGLDPSSRKKVGKYSLGMKQRLGIAQAMM